MDWYRQRHEGRPQHRAVGVPLGLAGLATTWNQIFIGVVAYEFASEAGIGNGIGAATAGNGTCKMNWYVQQKYWLS
jgi:hypothetical protein